jgi:hypothetical protein
MEIEKARAVLEDLGNVLGEHFADAIKTVLNNQGVATPRRVGIRERKILNYMSSLPGVPLTPGAVQAAIKLEHTPAAAMANLAQKGMLIRLGSGALYTFPEDDVEADCEDEG